MKQKTETFQGLLLEFQHHCNLYTAFDDFLTLAIATFGTNIHTGLSYDEDLYLETIAKYKESKLVNHFPKLLGCMIMEMEDRLGDSQGNDVLGDFYQEHLYQKGTAQYFTPWNVCLMMAQMVGSKEPDASGRPLRILDSSCGSGRMLVAGSRVHGIDIHYYGIDLDHTCVKMSALNMFLNGIFHGEVMWANALVPNDFKMSYSLSFIPFGIFRVKSKEDSLLWHLNAIKKEQDETPGAWPSEDGKSGKQGPQLELF